MPNPSTKGISVHVDRELHAEITAYLQEHNMKMADFIALAARDMLRPPASEIDPDLQAEIMVYLEEHDMTMDEFFARAAQKGLHPQVPGIDARLQAEIVALLLDKRNWEKIACLLLAVFILVILPVMALAAAFSTEGIDFTDPEIIAEIMENLTPEQIEELQFVEDTVQGIHLAMADRTPEQVKAAEVLFILALYDRAQEPDFIEKLAGCFRESQTDEQLITEVNAAFGTALDPDDFSAIMNYANDQLVEIAKSQLGNVGGKPFWSWYGFGGRVEWCACFVSWCANQCGYIDRGIIPKFSSCTIGANWFKSKGQWLNGSAVPASGMIVFFDWPDEYGVRDGLPDHVGIVEKVEGRRIYTIEGNSGDVCRRNSYPVGYSDIFGYGTPNLF